MFFLIKLVDTLITPPGIFICLLIVAFILLIFKKRKIALILMIVNIICIYLLSTPFFSSFLASTLENIYIPIQINSVEKKENTIVLVLSAGSIEQSPEYERVFPTQGTLARIYYGVMLATKFECEIICSGGNTNINSSDANAMKYIASNAGIPSEKIIVESDSLTTFENINNSKKYLENKKVYLVTSAIHMKRAMLSASKNNINVIASPCDYRHDNYISFLSFLPQADALSLTQDVFHEYIGILFYSIFK